MQKQTGLNSHSKIAGGGRVHCAPLVPTPSQSQIFFIKTWSHNKYFEYLVLVKANSIGKQYLHVSGTGSVAAPGVRKGRTEPGTMSGSDLELAFVTDGRTRKKECIGPERPRRSD